MDKRTVIAFVLIGVVFMAWSFLNVQNAPKKSPADSTVVQTGKDSAPLPSQTTPTPAPTAVPPAQRLPARYAPLLQGKEEYITVETPLYKAMLNTRGGLLARFELKNYKSWRGDRVQLIDDSTGFGGELALSYMSDGKQVTTEDLFFTIDSPRSTTLGEKDSVTITARLRLNGATDTTAGGDSTGTADSNLAAGGTIVKRFTFHGNSFGIGLDVQMENMEKEISGGAYDIHWKKGLKYQEHNSVDESGKAKTMLSLNDELAEVDAAEVGVVKREKFDGTIHWVGANTKYFGTAIIPAKPLKTTALVEGHARSVDSSGLVETYAFDLRVPYSATAQAQNFTLFLGPLDYDVVEAFGLESMVDFGMRFLIRPIGEYFLMPIFSFLHSFIPNYGVVIIVFSLLIRLLLWPLSIPQIKSSRKMQLLQPRIAEMREKYKDDQQRQQMETMALYREYGINPVGGCLPMLLQMPILYALWGTLSSAIDLRQAGFALWIHDLSIPDQIINLPFNIPLLGDKLSGLALIMGATLFIQQKMMLTDPKQKALIYFMPILLTLAFNHLPSGLNLYYLTFNLLSIGQQVYMTKYSKNTLTLEQMRDEAKTKKKGWLSQKLEEAQKMAAMQQGTTPGGANGTKVDGRTAVEPRKRK